MLKTFLLFLLLSVSFQSLYGSMPKGVMWHHSSVAKAFKLAKAEHKPLFLYWGAIWCPPCNKMKKTVFSRPEFQKEISNYIAVYLDGDDPSAQLWGEKLGAKGYPTMLLFSPQGKELTRMPIGVPVKKYVEILSMASKNGKTIKEILVKVLKGEGSHSDWRVLSNYSFSQDHERSLAKKDQIPTFKKLLKIIPAKYRVERSQIFFQYLSYLGEDKKYVLEKSERAKLKELFKSYIGDQKIVSNSFELIIYSSKDFLGILFDKDSRKLGEQLIKNMVTGLRASGELEFEQKLSLYYPEIVLSLEQSKKVSADLQKRLAGEVVFISKKKLDKFERQDVMSTAIYLLVKTEQYKLARELATKEIKKSIAPFYFMLNLASISEKEKNKKEALVWSERAWVAAKGSATRFQMGASYIKKMIDHKSDSEKVFSKTALLFKELIKSNQSFHGRNSRVATKLLKKLSDFGKSKKQSKKFTKFIKKLKLECSSLSNEESCVALVDIF